MFSTLSNLWRLWLRLAGYTLVVFVTSMQTDLLNATNCHGGEKSSDAKGGVKSPHSAESQKHPAGKWCLSRKEPSKPFQAAFIEVNKTSIKPFTLKGHIGSAFRSKLCR